jgi:hypothetical protein
MGTRLNAHPDHPTPTGCENCSAVLQGHYCHVCGQRAHNPLRSFAHAVEEVFESLWHLDGRIFRTMVDLFVPGRVAANYLRGHRVRYIAPLRLFLILTLIAFFFGKLVLNVDKSDFDPDAGGPNTSIVVEGEDGHDSTTRDIDQAKTAEEVIALHAQAIADIDRSRQDPVGRWIMRALDDVAVEQFRKASLERLRTLKASPEQILTIQTANDAAMARAAAQGETGDGWFDRWLARKAERIEANARLVREDPNRVFHQFLGAIPGALFVLVPLFALLLKLVYVRSGRAYLEHLVVGLYSHAFMMACLLLVFLSVGLANMLNNPEWMDIANGIAIAVVSLAVPLYLLLTQKRVYAQGWFKTLVKYLILGSVYSILAIQALTYAVLVGFSS